jgi:tryptophanyl-tRNA synthetase
MQKRLFSGVQPSGNLHVGNYLGAIQNWVKLQDDYEAIFCVVDLHAITVPQDPLELYKKTLEIAKIYLAAGIDPNKSTLFVQSHVKEHTELAWILNTITKNGDLTKMTQFKDKSDVMDFDDFERALKEASGRPDTSKSSELKRAIEKLSSLKAEDIGSATAFETARHFFQLFKEQFNNSNVGLFDYPVLMAADILLYDTAAVPVGEDQLQHVELTRTLARRFNDRFGETFVVPEAIVQKEGARIMGLDDPTKKMSKSAASEYNYIALTDDAETVRRKIKKAVTDSGSEIVYADEKPALKNLINIYSLLSGKSTSEVAALYQGNGPDFAKASTGKYSDFKNGLAEVIVNFLTPFQERLKNISDEEASAVLKAGAEKARALAQKKMQEVNKRVGFLV